VIEHLNDLMLINAKYVTGYKSKLPRICLDN